MIKKSFLKTNLVKNDSSILDVIKSLNNSNEKICLIKNLKNKICGVITDGDLRRKLNSKFFEKKASEIMTKNPTLANKDMLVGEALNLMSSKKITSLFICENKKPIGIIHIHDLLRLTS